MFRVSVEKLHSALKYNVEFPFGKILEMIAFKLKIAPTPHPMSFQWIWEFSLAAPFLLVAKKPTERWSFYLD